MSAVGFVFGAIGTVDLCLKYTKILIKLCQTIKFAKQELQDRIRAIGRLCTKTTKQLAWLQDNWRILDEEVQRLQTEIFEELNGKLSLAIKKIERIRKTADYVGTSLSWLFMKDSLDEIINGLRHSAAEYDPRWYIALAAAKSPLAPFSASVAVTGPSSQEDEFKRNIEQFQVAASGNLPPERPSFLLERDSLPENIKQIRDSPVEYGISRQTNRVLIIDVVKMMEGNDQEYALRGVRHLATKLSSSAPTLLPCRGAVRQQHSRNFQFVFDAPDGSSEEPVSLREILPRKGSISYSLTKRLHLAKLLARSVSSVHTLGFVHKNIRPEVLIGMKREEESEMPALDSFFLFGFHDTRTLDGRTLLIGSEKWEENLYRHPERKGLKHNSFYIMQHDIYSLGVCLLEIGLWLSFVKYDRHGKASFNSTAGYYIAEDIVVGNSGVQVHKALLAAAKKYVAKNMGDKYAAVVVSCLTCLDDDNVDFGNRDEFRDIDGIEVGVRYIDRILSKLESISA